MTDKEKVRAVYPEAFAMRCWIGCWHIKRDKNDRQGLSKLENAATIDTEYDAWQNAAESLPAQPEQEYNPHVFQPNTKYDCMICDQPPNALIHIPGDDESSNKGLCPCTSAGKCTGVGTQFVCRSDNQIGYAQPVAPLPTVEEARERVTTALKNAKDATREIRTEENLGLCPDCNRDKWFCICVGKQVAEVKPSPDLKLWLDQAVDLLNLYHSGYCPKDVAKDFLEKCKLNFANLTDCKPSPDMKPPRHAFEVSIKIGANEASYVARALAEISETIDRSGVSGAVSGGWDGSWSIDVAKRAITPERYRQELQEWRQRGSDAG